MRAQDTTGFSTRTQTLLNKTEADFRFNVRDSAGREVGCLAMSYEAVFVAASNNPNDSNYAMSRTMIAPGRYFVGLVSATRNGAIFGAARRHEMFTTVEERNEYVTRRIEECRKRAAKIGGAQ